MSNVPTLLNTAQAARLVGLSASTLEKMRVRGDGPLYLRAGRRKVMYTPDALTSWLQQHKSTSEYAA